jgi:hypothetical protein
MTEQQIQTMVNRFLCWKLPADFAPDAGITFKPLANADSPVELQYKHEPIGTNLFTADQAKAMFEHVLQGPLDQPEGEPVAWEAEYGVGLIKYITDAQYKKFTLSIRRHYRPFKCLLCKTHPAPFTPITSDDVTDKMLDDYLANSTLRDTTRAMLAAAVNAYMGAKK